MQRLAAGQIVHGRYVLETMLGRGGMGSVWRARDRRLGRHVAVKFMAARLQGSAIAKKRFEREASISSKLQSRHVVRIHDHGIEEATPFLVMELLEGEDLGARLQRQGRLPPEEATRILVDVCRGLRRAHEAGLVHRDLKPANVFLAREGDGTETAKILDFGVVKTTAATFEESVATESGTIVGSVQYASPEQAEGARDLDARSDLWSVAALAFRVLTGRLPFPGEALGTVVLAICSKPLPRPTEVAPDLPPAIDTFFDRAFQRDRDARFQTALELSDALVAALHGEAVDGGRASDVPEGRATVPNLDGFGTSAPTRVIDLAAAAQRSVLVDEGSPVATGPGEVDDAGEPTRTFDATPAAPGEDAEDVRTELLEAPTQLVDVGFDAERSTGGAIVSPVPTWRPDGRRRLARRAVAAASVVVLVAFAVAWLGGDREQEPAPATAAAVPSPEADATSRTEAAPAPSAMTGPRPSASASADARTGASDAEAVGAAVDASADPAADAPPETSASASAAASASTARSKPSPPRSAPPPPGRREPTVYSPTAP